MSRSGVAANPNMDNLSYKYDYYNNNPAEGLRSNRLYHVNDAVSSTGYDDIQDQGSFVPESPTNDVNLLNNYGYDELGNLVRDNQEEIASIEWTVYGKIKKVIRTGGSTKPNLEFVYDPMGHRIAKIETPNPYVATEVKTTFYGRDAQGNHLVTYDHHWNPNTSNEHLLLDERIIYGSNRLGLQDFNDSIWGSEDVPPVLDYYERNLGRKKYEGTNHLGNVLAVYSDKKLPKDDITPGGPIDYYVADIHGAYDYYSFGSAMPERTFVPEACSTQTLIINNYSYQDNFPNPVPLWNPVGGAAIGWAGPGAMTVNCNIPNEGVQQVLPCVPGVQNTLDLTLTFGNNDIQIMLLDPLTMLPLPGYPILYPAQPFGTVLNIQLFFIGPPAGNVIVQITSPGGPFPFPDMFIVNYAAISTQTTLQQQVCWDEDYRFGFNGLEKDNEVKGQGNHISFGDYGYDTRLGRRFSPDPKGNEFPFQSQYSTFNNNPFYFADPSGQTGVATLNKETKTITVSVHMVFYGGKAETSLSNKIATGMASQWNGAHGKVTVDGVEYDVKFRVSYETVTEAEATAMAATNTNFKNNFVRVDDMGTMSSGFEEGGNAGYLNTNDDIGGSTTPAHELGHALGYQSGPDGDGDASHSVSGATSTDRPDIMTPRRTIVDPRWSKVGPSNEIDPNFRRANQTDIDGIFKSVTFDVSGKANIGTMTTNNIYDNTGTAKP